MSRTNDSKEGTGSPASRQPERKEQASHGRSGHGAASAFAQMVARNRVHRHHAGDAEDVARTRGQ